MRVLLWFTVGLAAACGCCCYFSKAGIILLAVACVIVGAVQIAKWRYRKQVTVLAAGIALGLVWTVAFECLVLATPRRMDGVSEIAEFTASSYGEKSQYGTTVECSLLRNGYSYRTVVYLQTDETVSPGDTLHGSFRFYSTAGKSYRQGEGIFLTAYPNGAVTISPGSSERFVYFPAKLHRQLLERINRSFPQDTAAFAGALLLGETNGLAYEADTALKLSGLRHIVAVSGLHISILTAAVSFLTRKRRFLTAIVGIPVLMLFSAMAGFTPSILRACVMQSLYLLAICCNREYDPPTALSAAVCGMLLCNPMMITSASFQMSVSSVIGIFAFAGKIHKRLLRRLGGGKGKNWSARCKRWLAASLSVTLSATSLITPLVAVYMGTVSLVGIVANLLTLWCIPFLFCGIAAVCAVSLFCQTAAGMIAVCVSVLIRYVLGVAGLLSAFPLSAVYTQSLYIVFWLIASYVLFAVFLLFRGKHPVLYVSTTVVLLCGALLLSWGLPLKDHYRLTVVNVGQGQCILLQSEGKTYMVDCGGDSPKAVADRASEILLSQGVTKLDGLILTHYDLDHVGAVQYLLTRIPADMLYLPAAADKKGLCANLSNFSAQTQVNQDLCLAFGGTELTVFASDSMENSNESSLCVLFQRENCAILITGDKTASGELELLQKGLPHIDVLIAGHHGAGDSTGKMLLSAVKPECVVISVGKNNTFGHPAQSLLQRLEEFGCLVRRTDVEGTIIIRG